MPEIQLSGLAGTFLGDMDAASLARVLAEASLVDVAVGRRIFATGPQPRLGVVLDGVARSYIMGSDGRQLTLRYVRPPAVLTTASTPIALSPVPISNHAVTNVTVLELNMDSLGAMFDKESGVGFAFANEVSRRLTDVYRCFAATFFGSLRERLATHLLQAAEPVPGRGLFAHVTQVELAEALGTAREVVGRALRQFQHEHIVIVKRGGVEIVDSTRLLASAGQWGWPAQLFGIDASGHADGSYDKLAQPVVGVEESGQIVYANPAVTGTFGMTPVALVGRDLDVLLSKDAIRSFREVFAAFGQDPTPRPIALAAGLNARGPGQVEFPVEITAVPVRRRGTLVVFATLVDVSYRRALRELVTKREPTAARPAPRSKVEAAQQAS